MPVIEEVKSELERKFPEYTFTVGKRIYGACVIAKKTKYSGADIFVKENNIIIESAIPEMKTRIWLGGGAIFLKFFNKAYSEPSLRIKDYLSSKYDNVKLKL